MNVVENIKVAFGALTTNRTRSMLTMLGVIIGVGAVVALVSLGQGVQNKITDTLGSVGTNMIQVNTYTGYARFTPEDGQAVMDKVTSLSHYSPWVTVRATAKHGTATHATDLHGAGVDGHIIYGFDIAEGRFFGQREVDTRQNVAVLGHSVAKQLFKGGPALGEDIMVRGQTMKVIGVLEEKGFLMGEDIDDLVLAPYTTVLRMLGTRYVPMLMYKVASSKDAVAARTHITRILELKCRNAERPSDDPLRTMPFMVMSMDELVGAANTVLATLTVFLAGIAAISLLVGGVGIMNIMLVSVTERYREIGIRKAVGARRKDILVQFLIEAVILSVTGGLIGLASGAALAKGIGRIAELDTAITMGAVATSLGFACVVGVFFGVYPANKAARLDPIDALRFD